MLLIVHVGVALASVIYTGWALYRPTYIKLNISYALVLGTLVTGIALVFAHPEALPQACVSGLIYLQIVAVGIIFVHRKLRRLQAPLRDMISN